MPKKTFEEKIANVTDEMLTKHGFKKPSKKGVEKKVVKLKIGSIMKGDENRCMKIIGKMDKFYLYIYFGDSMVFARTESEIQRTFEFMEFSLPLTPKKK